MIREIVSPSKGFDPHNFFKTMNNTELTLDQLAEVVGGFSHHANVDRLVLIDALDVFKRRNSVFDQEDLVDAMKIGKVNASKNPFGSLICIPSCY